jgi:hypothetical protein
LPFGTPDKTVDRATVDPRRRHPEILFAMAWKPCSFCRGIPVHFGVEYSPQAFDAGYRLLDDADLLWQAFEAAHHKASLPGKLEIPMESFVRAIEIVLKESELKDAPDYCPEAALWTYAVHHCGYVQSRHATGRTLATA